MNRERFGRMMEELLKRGNVVFYDSHCGCHGAGYICTFTPTGCMPRPYFAHTPEQALARALEAKE